MAGDREQPRRPKDMKGLLKFCLEATKGEDAPEISDPESSLAAMGEERKKWLEEAIQSMSVDVIEQLGNGIKTLIDPSAELELKEDVLDCLEDWLGNIDMAINFHKIGGFQALLTCLGSPHPSLRSGSCHLSAEIAQNNPYIQEKLLMDGFLEKFLDMTDNDSDIHCQVKALYAMSCLVRDSKQAIINMSSLDGWSVVLRAVMKEDIKLRSKACFLVSAVAEDDAGVAADMVSRGLISQLLHILSSKTSEIDPELPLRALNSLLSASKPGREEADRLQVVQVLGKRLGEFRGKEEFEISQDYCQDILKMFVDPSCGQSEVNFRSCESWDYGSQQFVPTSEWKEVGDGQAISPGCLVQMDLQTGVKRAKIDPDYELPSCLR